jgi:hypothetical protein
MKILPRVIQLNGMLIQSESLLNESKLHSNDVLKIGNTSQRPTQLDMAKILDDYQVGNQLLVEMNSLGRNYVQLSEQTTLFELDLMTNFDASDLTIENVEKRFKLINNQTSSFKLNALLYWVELTVDSSFYSPLKSQNDSTNQLGALCLFDAHTIDSGKRELATKFWFTNGLFHLKVEG